MRPGAASRVNTSNSTLNTFANVNQKRTLNATSTNKAARARAAPVATERS